MTSSLTKTPERPREPAWLCAGRFSQGEQSVAYHCWQGQFATGDLYARTRFNRIDLDLGLGPEFKLGETSVALEAGATLQWIGMKPYQDTLRLGIEARRPLGRTTFAVPAFPLGA